jgi:hypothetical protein
MTELGANPAQLDDLAALIGGLAGDLSHRRLALTVWIEGDRFWRGNRANEFRHEWTSTYAPLMANACDYLNSAVKTLHENANQQRVASGESPKDYGGGSFLHRLFNDAVHDVEHAGSGVLHGLERFGHDAMHDAGTVWSLEVAGFHEVVSSSAFGEAVKVVQVLNTAFGIAALVPGLQEVAVPLMLATSGVLMAAHLAQMANEGHFNPVQFGEDALNVASAGLANKALKLEQGAVEVARAAGGTSDEVNAAVQTVKDSLGVDRPLIPTAKDVSSATVHSVIASMRSNPTRTAMIVVHTGQAVDTAAQTSYKVGNDIASGDLSSALYDGSVGVAETTADGFGLSTLGGSIQGGADVITESGATPGGGQFQ